MDRKRILQNAFREHQKERFDLLVLKMTHNKGILYCCSEGSIARGTDDFHVNDRDLVMRAGVDTLGYACLL
jgi:hypothetical protein